MEISSILADADGRFFKRLCSFRVLLIGPFSFSSFSICVNQVTVID
jgi:hypothetical protein